MMRKYFAFVLILVVCTGLGLLFFFTRNKKKYIAFHSLPAETVQAVQTALKNRFADIERHFDWITVDPAVSATEFMEKHPKTVFVFSTDNKSLFEARSFFIRHQTEAFRYLPSTFLNTVFPQDAAEPYYAFPLLINPVKLACSAAVAEKLGIGPSLVQEDFERLFKASEGSAVFPFVCAGGEDEPLFAMISAVAAIRGSVIKPDDFSVLGKDADLQASCPSALKEALGTLIEWRRQGFLHPEWFRLLERDVSAFMEFNNTTLAAMPLSASRRLKPDILHRFVTVQIPLPQLLSEKNMPAEVLVWAQAVQDKNKPFPAADEIREFLYSQEACEVLAQATGLAPVFSAAQTQDAEASSGRYWAASSNTVFPFFGDMVCTTETEKGRLAAEIRRYLEVNGIGY